MKTCSVIIPAYNAEQYINQCITSVREQTYTALQIIIVNDGSTDNTDNIISQHANQDNRIQVITQNNKGQANARNTALDYANGNYICFLDADDMIQPKYIQTLINEIGESDIIQAGFTFISQENKQLQSKIPHFRYQFTAPWARLYKRPIIADIRFPDGMIYEDVVFSLNLWAKKPKITLSSYCGYHYRLNPASTTAHRHKEAEKRLYDNIKKSKAPLWLKIYTFLRLKCHFALNKR